MATNGNTQSAWKTETESAWQPGEVSPRNMLLWFIVQRVKQGASKDQLLEEVPEYIEQNQLPPFLQGDVEGMISWAVRKFSPPSTGE